VHETGGSARRPGRLFSGNFLSWRFLGWVMNFGKISSSVLLAVGFTAGSVVPARAAAELYPEDFYWGVAAISPTRAVVELNWKYDAQSTFQVDEVINGDPVPRPGATATGWSSHNESPGSHTYRVTRTVNGVSAWSQANVVIPTRNVIGTQYANGWLVSAQSVGATNSNGAVIKREVGFEPAVSPDRRTLAASVRDSTGSSLWLFDTEGQAIRSLTQGTWDSEPAFSPDGRTVAFVRRATYDGVPSVYVVDATTPDAPPTPVTGADSTSSPAWTPDGDSLVLESGDGTANPSTEPLRMVQLATGTTMTLTGTEGGHDPAVSRTGQVAFHRDNANHDAEVMVTDLQGAPAVRWSPDPVQDWNWFAPAWDPQGKSLAWLTNRVGSSGGSTPQYVTGPGQQPISLSAANPFSNLGLASPAWFDANDAAPTVSLSAPAATTTASTTATIAVADADDAIGGLSVSCRIDSGPVTPCEPGSWQIPAQKAGAHTLTVSVTDPNGRTATVTKPWLIDQIGPVAALRGPAQPFTLASTIPVSWTASDTGSGVASYQVRWTRAPFNAGYAAWQYPAAWQKLTTASVTFSGAAPGYTHCFQVRGVDKLGNVGAWSAVKCSAVPLDDRSLGASAGWARGTSSAFYRGTATVTTKAGAYLSRPGAALSRLAIVATKCASCGSVRVYVNNVSIGVVSLYSARLQYRAVIALPAFAYRTGTVVVKVTSSGKLVQIDGLGTSRA
jgi:hypothetical protein